MENPKPDFGAHTTERSSVRATLMWLGLSSIKLVEIGQFAQEPPPMMMAPKMMIHIKMTIGNAIHIAMMHIIQIVFLNI